MKAESKPTTHFTRALLTMSFVLAAACSDSTSTAQPADAATSRDAATLGADAAADAALTTAAADAAIAAPPVTVSGPITTGMGKPFSTSIVDLGPRGYVEKEFFYEGDSVAYAVQGKMSMDGKWKLTETTKAHFKTRLMVRRPMDAKKFNGTVIVEWLNVSGGADGDPGYMYNWEEILREGYVWVGVSAQSTGVEGGGFALLASPPPPLKKYDPARYGSLSHPGDAYSFDIFTRAAQIVRGAGKLDVLDGLEPKRLIAYGESQSAMRMVSYVDGVHPLVRVFDGFFIHSRGASALPFTNDAPLSFGGSPVFIRDDIEAKVFQFQTETDVSGFLGMSGFSTARQPDSERLRTWEVAGTAHADKHILEINPVNSTDGGISCPNVNDGPQHFVIKAALHALNLWMVDGTAPVTGELLKVDVNGKPMADADGNTLGGVRTPTVDVPTETLSGQPPAGQSDVLCALFGSTTAFTQQKLLQRYPTHADYVTKVKDSARKTREAKFILAPEEQTMLAQAQAAAVPK